MASSNFDPSHAMKLLLDPVGGYEWSLKRSMEESKARGGLGNSAHLYLGQAIECLLVGFDEPAELLLKKATEWVQLAITSDEHPERYFPGATEASRYQTLALCNWLISDEHDLESLGQFVAREDCYLKSIARMDKVDISLTVLTYVDAGAFERALEILGGAPGLSKPTSLSAHNEAQMAYILSRSFLGLEYNQEDITALTVRFLAKNIDKWLSNGHWVRAAEWMKIIHWNNAAQRLSAKQILMKCYDYLVNRHPPE